MRLHYWDRYTVDNKDAKRQGTLRSIPWRWELCWTECNRTRPGDNYRLPLPEPVWLLLEPGSLCRLPLPVPITLPLAVRVPGAACWVP